ncbi:MAG: [protein-PII] uridylyltransferase [Zetaproteobacteria bacterium CG_4_9_14_3_um_filter_49_83]|nr:MAG: [protein-PII] uridylyltransferase [Zetaproteobacteria bacterium CG1_02_49_23]PIQ30661.1 MAG: [protein-PII] uridylyltransferase [Zetaproteobacteria bacterium CG17_big_fil_post_rev_8_21_14_2_50_50_13]PIV30623.1 MAG: [protein-PII] uridylyltransferase [Zetaproteobacteria bacterium CG02_land_8_20_14_3_00_50_9]PIY55124.1 MAG: [protein-PII] uridylyltransferase [Zetaproteobacteria bacterium CG_4_10_14_0_8_um_filter_49_80]PJA35301.1 MAG: [protein-PII] uridylyltransferase [Zetaproteobacteria bact
MTYKEKLKALLAEVSIRFEQGDSGEVLVRQMSAGIDQLLSQCWLEKAPDAQNVIDLVAVGGYGREELAPLSDWDIWFLVPDELDELCSQQLHAFLNELWDMGGKVGYAVRSVKESILHIQEDWESATAALEMRLLQGKGEHVGKLKHALKSFFKRKRKAFVTAKLLEVEQRHNKSGNTAFLMEPDIKENRGGLRDVQAVFWMMKVWYDASSTAELVKKGAISKLECHDLLEAQDFLWRCRVGIHLERRRVSDRLNFELQALLAEKTESNTTSHRPAVEIFMKQYFRYAGRIGRVTGMLFMDFHERLNPKYFALTKQVGDGFVLRGKQLGIRDHQVFKEDPLRLLRIFHATQMGERFLSSQALRQIRQDVLFIDDAFRANPEAHRTFIMILRDQRNVAWALREMNNTGVLGRFIPAFRDVVGLGQFNRYHAYTVDEHTIRAVGEARNFFHGDHEVRLPLAHEVWHKINRPELLYLALIFHDIAKGLPGDHSQEGEILAREFCVSIGLSKDASELVAWLVRWHLHMAVVSQRSDLSDVTVIEQFAEDVVDVERLNYLFLLTVADISAVGPNVWNDWKGALLTELYQSTVHHLMHDGHHGEALKERIANRIESVLIRTDEKKQKQIESILTALPWRCLLSLPPRHLLPVVLMLEKSAGGQLVDVFTDEVRCEMMVMVVAQDRRSLFAMLATSISASHIQILSAQAYYLDDHRVLDIFYIQNLQEGVLPLDADIKKLYLKISDALSGKVIAPPKDVVSQHILMRKVPVRVRELLMGSDEQTVIEVSAADRPGLLSRLLWVISDLGYDLRGATISTFGERAVDVFFVRGKDMQALTGEDVEQLRSHLLEVATLSEN